MKLKEPTFTDLLIDTHIGLERQGPGSIEATEKALGFIDGIDETSRIADLGCGTGGETLTITKHVNCEIKGVDIFPQFISVFNENMNTDMDSKAEQKDSLEILASCRSGNTHSISSGLKVQLIISDLKKVSLTGMVFLKTEDILL